MKKKIFISFLLVSTVALFAFTASDAPDETIHVSVVHHSQGTLLVLDTSFSESSGYSVEQFLLDHGLDPSKAEIVNTSNIDGAQYIDITHDVWFVNGTDLPEGCDFIFRTNDAGAEVGSTAEISIESTVDDAGKMVVHKFVNGQEVEDGADDNVWFGEEGTFQLDSLNGSVILIEEGEMGDDGVLHTVSKIQAGTPQNVKIVRITDGDSEGDEGQNKDGEVALMELNVEVETEVDENGEEVTHVWVNGEEIDPEDCDQYLIEMSDGEGEYEIVIESIEEESDGKAMGVERVVMIQSGDAGDLHFGSLGKMEYTLVLVTKESTEGATKKAVLQSAKIQDLTFAPNPNGGQFNVSFTLPEKGKTEILIHDVQGKEVYRNNLGKFQGSFTEQIDISDAGPGTYILTVTQGNSKLAEKLLIQ